MKGYFVIDISKRMKEILKWTSKCLGILGFLGWLLPVI